MSLNTRSDDSSFIPISLYRRHSARRSVETKEFQTRLDALCAELIAIEHCNWLDRTSANAIEQEALELRLARREMVTSEIQMLFALQRTYVPLD